MQVELNIPPTLERKIRALFALLGGDAGSMDDIVVTLMDRTVTDYIKQILDEPSEVEESPAPTPEPFRTPTPRFQRDYAQFLDDGLGDDAPSDDIEEELPPPVKDMYELIPKGSKKALEELEREMEVEDPEHEAKASADDMGSVFAGGEQATDMFSHMMGLPSVSAEEPLEIDPRIAKRKKKLNIKGKVTPASEISESF